MPHPRIRPRIVLGQMHKRRALQRVGQGLQPDLPHVFERIPFELKHFTDSRFSLIIQ